MAPDAVRPALRGLIVDYGGVLTTPVTRSFRAFCRDLGLPSESVKETFLQAYRAPGGEQSAVHLVETGAIGSEEFGVLLATLLTEKTGIAVPSEGLLTRMFAQVSLDEEMFAAVAGARRAGIRTALLSNSWGDDGYPRDRFGDLFDTVVISGEVGLRKPDPQIYAVAADRLGLPADACVFVDDLDTNVLAAEAAGMTGIVHADSATTVARLCELLGVQRSQLTHAPSSSTPGSA